MSDTVAAISLHDEAIGYAKRGIPVFPMMKNGDWPMVARWGVEATVSLDQINIWWTKNPAYNIGILTGAKSGILVLHFKTPEAWLIGRERGLPVAPTVKVGNSYQVYCRYTESVENILKSVVHVDVRVLGENGYVMAPPSLIGKNLLSWGDGKGLGDLELGEAPEWMLDRTKDDDETIVEAITAIAEDNINIIDTNSVSASSGEDMPGVVEVLTLLETKTEATSTGSEVLAHMDTIGQIECEALPENVQDWKAPVLFEGVGVADIKAELLPTWLGEYAGAVSRSTQTPEGLAIMLGLSAVATCVQKKFEVCPYGDDYIETLSLWTVTVLQSSERKTPVLKAMIAPIYAWEKEQAEMLKATIDETATQIQIGQKRIEKIRQQAANEADAVARQELVRDISAIQASMPAEVRAPRLWTGDTTAESLQDLLADNGEKMAVLSDEGGIFEIMAGLYNDGKVNIDIYLQAYAGMSTRIERKSRKVNLDRPALTFGLTVQPVVIEGFASGSKKQFRGKGALGRFLFCIPESMLGKRDIGRRVPVSSDVKGRYEAGIRGLLSLQMTLGATGCEVPRMLELDDEALIVWEDFGRRVEGMLGAGGELAAMGDWGGKLPGTALRIAGLLHLVEHGTEVLILGKETLDRSIGLCNVLMGHAKAAFGLIGADETVSDAKKVFMWMQKNRFEVFTKTECARALKGISELDSALRTLEERNILKELLVPTAGRSAANYVSNPILKSAFG